MPGSPELSDQEDVERRAKRERDFICDRHAATREREDDHVVAAGVRRQRAREALSGFTPVPKSRGHHVSPSTGTSMQPPIHASLRQSPCTS